MLRHWNHPRSFSASQDLSTVFSQFTKSSITWGLLGPTPEFLIQQVSGRTQESAFPTSPPAHQLPTDTCHLPLQGFNHVLLQLLTFNTP